MISHRAIGILVLDLIIYQCEPFFPQVKWKVELFMNKGIDFFALMCCPVALTLMRWVLCPGVGAETSGKH